MLFFTICAFVGLDTLGLVASYGAQGFTWLIVLAVAFVLPYALVMAEVGSTFTAGRRPVRVDEAGVRPLPRRHRRGLLLGDEPALGRRLARVHRDATPGVRACLARHRPRLGRRLRLQAPLHLVLDRRRDRRARRRASGSPPPAASRASSCSASSRSRRSSTPPRTACRASRPATCRRRSPSSSRSSPLPAVQLRRLRAPERRGRGDGQPSPRRPGLGPPQRHRSACSCTRSRSSCILLVLPAEQDHRASAASSTPSRRRSRVYGGAPTPSSRLMALGFIFTLMTSGAVWMIGSDRIQAVAAYDGASSTASSASSTRSSGTPVRVNVLSGIVASIFMIVAVAHASTAAGRGVLRRARRSRSRRR